MAIRTPVCDVLGIDVPIVCAPFGPWPQLELAAAVSNAGGLGSLGTAVRNVESLREELNQIRRLTERPFAVNVTRRPFDPAVFDALLEDAPPVISFHVGEPMDLIDRAHAVGSKWMHQVGNVDHAKRALDAGADVIIAQGAEAGGNAGNIAMSVIVPQVVDVAGDVPVLAAGGIGDGRGLAAALALGAQGVNIGTRFLASTELGISEGWKQAIVDADATDAVKLPFADHVMPPYTEGAYTDMTPRALRNEFVNRWLEDPQGAAEHSKELQAEIIAAVRAGNLEEYLPLTGQSCGLIRDVLPAAEIMSRMVEEAERSLARASGFASP